MGVGPPAGDGVRLVKAGTRIVAPELYEKQSIIAKDFHEVMEAHKADGNMCLNAICLAIAWELKAREDMGQSDPARRAEILAMMVEDVLLICEAMDEQPEE